MLEMWSTMNLNTGSLGKKETSTSAMRRARYMPSQRIWRHISQSISKMWCDCLSTLLQNLRMILINKSLDVRPILHKYANEDVSLGSWFIGLEVEHIDDRSMCCGTPPGFPLSIISFLMFSRRSVVIVLCTWTFSRLRVEGSGRKRVHCFIWLELQWYLQISGENEECPWQVRWRRWSYMECFVLRIPFY